jgi:hypothetical protein
VKACANSVTRSAILPKVAPAGPFDWRNPPRLRVYGTGRRCDGIAPPHFRENAGPKRKTAKGRQ